MEITYRRWKETIYWWSKKIEVIQLLFKLIKFILIVKKN